MKAAKRQRIYDRDGNQCVKCGLTTNLTIDHIIPTSYGGSNADDNLQTLCIDCNQAKADTLPPGVEAKRRRPTIRRGPRAKLPKIALQHHRYCDANYCFCECAVFLAEHPQFADSLRRSGWKEHAA